MSQQQKAQSMKAKLQKQKAYDYKDKPHFKHVIVVPENAVDALGWIGGEELELKVKDGHLTVQAKKKAEPKKETFSNEPIVDQADAQKNKKE